MLPGANFLQTFSLVVIKYKRHFLLVLILSAVFSLHQYKLSTTVYLNQYFKALSVPERNINSRNANLGGFRDGRCRPPSLEAFSKDALKFYSRPTTVNCATEFNGNSPFDGVAFTIKNGHHLLRLVHKGLSCCFQPLLRDQRRSNQCILIRQNVTLIPRHLDYIEVLCKSGESLIYRDAFPVVHVPRKLSKRVYPATPQLNLPLSVVIIGIDSASKLNFERQMPLSIQYMLNSSTAISLEDYSICGTGTIRNTVPLFTGRSYANFVENCARNFSECRFIWEHFSKRGYLTNFADDTSIFDYDYPDSFKTIPTDYYLRPYARYLYKYHPSVSGYCLGPRLSFETILNFVHSVRKVAESANRPHFQFTWATDLAHDHMNNLGLGDLPLLNNLKIFKESESLKNTVLFVMGDHGKGAALGSGEPYFWTGSGQIEYKTPGVYIVLPPWFPNHFPKEFQNLQHNSKKMTTAYDIHKTLLHLLTLDHGHRDSKYIEIIRQNGVGISLFEPVPVDRNCLEAGIPLYLCKICHPTIPLNSTAPLVNIAIKVIMDSMNSAIKDYHNLCGQHDFQAVRKAFKWDQKDVLRELCNNNEVSTRNTRYERQFNISCDGNDRLDIVNVQLTTTRGAAFLGQVIVVGNRNANNSPNKVFLTDDVLRQDRFFEKAPCVPPVIKMFCICL